jgi:hypothetical protein
MSGNDTDKRLPHSPRLALGFLALVALIYLLLGIGQGNSDIANSVEWVTWKFFASLATAIAVVSAMLGGSAVGKVKTYGQSDDSASPAARLAKPLGQQRPKGRFLAYIVLAVFLISVIFGFLFLGGGANTQGWPTDLHIKAHTRPVAIAIGLAAVPWLVLVWLVQDRLAAYAKESDPPSTAELRSLWNSLYAIVLAFAVFVVLALVTAGAVRLAYFAGAKDPAANKQGPEFPASDVLLYGAFFAILLSAIALPMVAAYRAAAVRRLRFCHPIEDPLDHSDKDATEWQESLLHLDIGLLKSPITALTVFTPLITAALAAYLPGLAD